MERIWALYKTTTIIEMCSSFVQELGASVALPKLILDCSGTKREERVYI